MSVRAVGVGVGLAAGDDQVVHGCHRVAPPLVIFQQLDYADRINLLNLTTVPRQAHERYVRFGQIVLTQNVNVGNYQSLVGGWQSPPFGTYFGSSSVSSTLPYVTL